MSASSKSLLLWPSRKIPYRFSDSYPPDNLVYDVNHSETYKRRQSLLDAMSMIEKISRIRFCQRQYEEDYIEFTYDEQLPNEASVGFQRGRIAVNVKTNYHGLHELLHVVGLIHEQSRSDRDTYVKVLLENIIDDRRGNYDLDEQSINLTEYDLNSVMHYPPSWNAISDGEITMYSLADSQQKLGPFSFINLSDSDAVGLRVLDNYVPGWSFSYNPPAGFDGSDVPGLAAYRGTDNSWVYAAWRGQGRSNNLYYAFGDEQGNWSNPFYVDGVTLTGTPGMAVFQDRLYVVWRDVSNSNNDIWYSSVDGRGVWSGRYLVPDYKAASNPALAVFGNRLYMAWVGQGVDRGIWYALSDGQNNWSTQIRLDGVQTDSRPALAVYNNRLYIVWRGWPDNGLWYGFLEAYSGVWSGPQRIYDYGTSYSPALGIKNGRLYAVWTGLHGYGIWYADFNGTSWSGQARIFDGSIASSPSVCSIVSAGHERLVMAWLPDGTPSLTCADFAGLATPTSLSGLP